MTRRRPLRSRRAPVLVAAAALALWGALGAAPGSAATADSWPSDTAGGAASSDNPGEAVLTPATVGRARLAWAVDRPMSEGLVAPTVVGGKVYVVHDTDNSGPPSTFDVRDARTGARLWTLALDGNAFYHRGVTVDAAHSLAFVSWQGSARPDGIAAIDLVHHRVAWTRTLPAPRYSWAYDVFGPGTVVSDGTRVYVSSTDNAVNAFRLTDGTPLWTVPLALRAPQSLSAWYGTAASGGIVYVGTDAGLDAYAASSGHHLWNAAAPGKPLVAGGRVFVARPGGVTAVSASGCGAATCPALWTRELGPSDTWPPAADGRAPRIGAASATTLYATWFDDSDDMHPKGWLVRLSAATGVPLWSAQTQPDPGTPSRGGNVVWLIANPGPVGSGVRSVVAYSAFARGTAPLFSYPMTVAQRGFYGGVALSGGTAVVQQDAGSLLAFRLPGT